MKVIAISGKAGSGKDTVGSILEEELAVDGYDVLLAHNADLVKFICSEYFGWDGKKDTFGRELLQYVGTDVVRSKNPDYWVDFIISTVRLFPDTWDYVIIPDCRFENELNRWRDFGYKVTHIRVERPGYDSGLTPEQRDHKSETALDNTMPDHIIYNDGSLSDLRQRIDDWLVDQNGWHQLTL